MNFLFLFFKNLFKNFVVNKLQTHFTKCFVMYDTHLVLSTQLVLKPYIADPDISILASFEAYLSCDLTAFSWLSYSLALYFYLGLYSCFTNFFIAVNSWDITSDITVKWFLLSWWTMHITLDHLYLDRDRAAFYSDLYFSIFPDLYFSLYFC